MILWYSLILMLCGFLWPLQASALVYYVSQGGSDGNPGTQGAPFRTVQRCANAAVAGDTCQIGAGTFTERLTMPTSGASGAPITFQGTRGTGQSWDTVLDGSVSTSGWVTAPEIGSGVWKITHASLGFTPGALTAGGRTVWKIGDPQMAGTAFGSEGTGPENLTKSSGATVTYFGQTVPYWDGIEALWGNLNGNLYLRFRNGENPSTRTVRVTPSAATVNVNGKSWLVFRDLKVVGGRYGFLLGSGSNNTLITQNYIANGERRVWFNGGNNTTLSNNIIRLDGLGFVDFTGGSWYTATHRHQYGINKFLVGTTDTNDCSIMVAGGSSNNTISGNEISNGQLGAQISETTTNTHFTANWFHHFSDSGIFLYPDNATLQIYSNLMQDATHHFRFNSVHRAVSVYIYANRSWQPTSGGKHWHISPDSSQSNTATIWVYHNTCAGRGWCVDVGGETSQTLPNMHVRNNWVSVDGLTSGPGPNAWDVQSNLFNNLWFGTASPPTFVPPAGHPARDSAPSLIPLGLPGMNSSFYGDGLPNYGAVQETGGTPPPGSFNLAIGKAGNGGGVVSSSPGGISCGSTCQASFVDGTVVTLSAVPDGGSQFGGWTGACSGTGTCVVTLSQDRSVTATFTLLPVEPPPAPPLVTSGATEPVDLRFELDILHTNPMVQTDNAILAGLRSWWRVVPPLAGGQVLHDLVGGGAAVLQNAVTVPWGATQRAGGHGELQFFGTDMYFTTETRTPYNGPFTVLAWARKFTSGSHLDLLGQISSGGWSQGWGLWTAGSDNRLRCALNSGENAALSLAVFPVNQWVHIACTWDGTNLTLYLDGVLQNTLVTSSSYPATLPLTIGALPGYTTGGWEGAVDDIMLFGQALPVATIQALRALAQHGSPGLLRRVRLPLPVLESDEPVQPPPPPGSVTVAPRETLQLLVP